MGGGGLPFGGGGGGGQFRRGIDGETLIEISALTGGEYYAAELQNDSADTRKRRRLYMVTGM